MAERQDDVVGSGGEAPGEEIAGDLRPETPIGRWANLRTAIGWAVSLAFLVGLALTVPVTQVWSGIRQLHPLAGLAAALVVTSSLWLRGERWALLLSIRRRIAPGAAAEVATVGLALNAVLPGRVGEVARIGIASRRFGVKMGTVAATVVTERLFDGLTLVAFLGGSLLALPPLPPSRKLEILGAEVSGEALGTAFISLGSVCLLLAAAIAAVSFAAPRRLALAGARRLPKRLVRSFVPRLESLLGSLSEGVSRLRELDVVVRTALFTGVLWLLVVAANHLIDRGMGVLHLDLRELLIVTAVSVTASSLPSAPGGWGVFEAGGVIALQALRPGVDLGAAVAFLFAAHACQYAPTVVFGYGLWWLDRRRDGSTAAVPPGSPTGTRGSETGSDRP